MVPLARDKDWRGALTLPPDEVVCVVKLGGSLIGRVGDLTLGLTKPVVEGGDCRGGGLLIDEGPAGFDEAAGARGVAGFSGGWAFFSGVFLAAGCWADVVVGVLGPLLAVGDFIGFAATLVADKPPRGFGVGFFVRVAGLGASFSVGFGWSFPPPVPFTLSTSGSGISGLPEEASLSVAPFDPGLLDAVLTAAGDADLTSCVS
jgi:hypothetical protein